MRAGAWPATLAFAGALSLTAVASSPGASGTWDRAWGKDVVEGGGSGFEICTLAASCRAGANGGLGGEMSSPLGVATDLAGNVYVADQGNQRIQKFDSQGRFLRAWGRDVVSGGGAGFEICTVAASCKGGASGGLGGDMNFPVDVATDAAGNVYVADFFSSRIQRFDSEGNWERAWGRDVAVGGGTGFEICTVSGNCKSGTQGGLGGEMSFLQGVATDTAGNVYAVDTSNHRIQTFDPQGNFLRAWGKDVVVGGGTGLEICTVAASCKGGTIGGLGGEMNFPTRLAIDSAGKAYAADTSNNRIQRFDSLGNFERAWGKDVVAGGGTGFEICAVAASCKSGLAGGLGGEMSNPLGVAIDSAGNVHVANQSNNRIERFDSLGNWERAWGRDVIASGGTGFETCAVAVSCKSGLTGGLGGEMSGPAGASTAVSGSLYVAEVANDRIQLFPGPACGRRSATRLGTPGPDTITGTPARDVIVALGGNDRVFTGPGDDLVCAGPGHDRVFTRAGVDRVFGAGGADRIFGGGARDFLFGQGGFDRLFGGPGHDRSFGGAGRDLLVGAAGRDRLFGGAGRDTLGGLAGRPDRCFGGAGRDVRRAPGCEIRRSIP